MLSDLIIVLLIIAIRYFNAQPSSVLVCASQFRSCKMLNLNFYHSIKFNVHNILTYCFALCIIFYKIVNFPHQFVLHRNLHIIFPSCVLIWRHFRTPFHSVVKLTPKSFTKDWKPTTITEYYYWPTTILSTEERKSSVSCMIYNQYKVVVDVIAESQLRVGYISDQQNPTKRKKNRVQLKRLLSYASQQRQYS